MENDTLSVTSAGSALSTSLEHVPCPYCNSDFQNRSIFRHIRNKHHENFIEACSESYLQTSKVGKPLKIYFPMKNDFGEDEEKTFYACLSTNKAFLQEQRCIQHFKKNPKALKDHNLQLQELQKEYLNNDKFSAHRNKLDRAKKTNDPKLGRSMWSSILNFSNIVEKIMPWTEDLGQDLPFDSKMFVKYGKLKGSEIKPFYLQTKALQAQLLQEKCLEYKPLEDLYTRLLRIVMLREHLSVFFPEFYPECPTNPDGYQNPTDEFGIAGDRMPKVNF